jgi:tetratricopeptide (TPR) repeat protein
VNAMKTKNFLFVLLLSLCLLASCVATQTSKNEKSNLVEKYIQAGESNEERGELQSALEQYDLALTLDADNQSALEHQKKVQAAMYETARRHYERGLALDDQGRYDEARNHYLRALQNWPEYTPAQEKLSSGGVSLDSKGYIMHTLLDGQSVSKLSLIYYGDLKQYPIIGKFNNMTDVTRVRAGDKLKIPALNGLTVDALQQRYTAYMKERKEKREKQIGPSKSAVVGSPRPAAPPESVAVPDNTDTPRISEPSDVADPNDATDVPPGREVSEPKTAKAAPDKEHTKVSPVGTPSDYDQAMTLFQQKKYDQAIPLFKKAQTENPDNTQIGANLFESYFRQGLAQFKKEQYFDARQSFSSAMQYNDDCDQCRTYIKTCEDSYKEKHYNLGIHYFGKEQLEQAINEWTQVEKVDPDYKDVQSNLKKARILYERLESIKQSNAK